jgi:perosamine synthetase
MDSFTDMSDKFLYCDGPGISPKQIISACWNGGVKFPDWFQFANREVILTHQGRGAIALICQILNIGSGDEVLMPAYNCGTEVDPFVWAGANVVFYGVDNRAAIDVEDIIRRITPSTKIIYVTHYFGWPQEMNELFQWCKKRDLYLLEDCALSLFSKGPDDTMGRTGAAAIYSFPKSLPVPDGGALVLAKDILIENKNMYPPGNQVVVFKTLSLLKKWMMNNSNPWQYSKFTRNLFVKSWRAKSDVKGFEVRPDMPKDYYFDVRKINWSISRLSGGILRTMNPIDIIEKRRRNYEYLYNSLADIPALRPLFDKLLNNVCPLSFPALVNDRGRWCKALKDYGIFVGGWWAGYHRSFNWEEFPEARKLKNNLLTLPVHQSLDIVHMEHIAKSVRFLAEGILKTS